MYDQGNSDLIAPVISGTVGIELGEHRQMFWPAAVMVGSSLQPISYTVEVTAASALAPPPTFPETLSETAYITTEQGIQYVTLIEGIGETVELSQTLNLIYHVWTAAGQYVYSTVYSGRETMPYLYGSDNLAGFDAGLSGATVGETRQILIPAGVAPPSVNGVSEAFTVQIQVVSIEAPTAVGLTAQNVEHVHLSYLLVTLFPLITFTSIVVKVKRPTLASLDES